MKKGKQKRYNKKANPYLRWSIHKLQSVSPADLGKMPIGELKQYAEAVRKAANTFRKGLRKEKVFENKREGRVSYSHFSSAYHQTERVPFARIPDDREMVYEYMRPAREFLNMPTSRISNVRKSMEKGKDTLQSLLKKEGVESKRLTDEEYYRYVKIIDEYRKRFNRNALRYSDYYNAIAVQIVDAAKEKFNSYDELLDDIEKYAKEIYEKEIDKENEVKKK